MDKAHSHCRTDRGHSRSNSARHQEPQNLTDVLQLEYATIPALDQPSREEALACVDEAESDSEPSVPANREIGGRGCDDDGRSHRHTRAGSQRDQRAYRDARGRPERGYAWLCAKGQTKPSRHEIGNAYRDGEAQRAQPRMPGIVGCLPALLVQHP